MEANRFDRFWEMLNKGFVDNESITQVMSRYLADEYERCGQNLAVLKGILIGVFYTISVSFSASSDCAEGEIHRVILDVQEAKTLSELLEPLNTVASRYCRKTNENYADGIALLAMHRIETNYAQKVLLKDIAQDLYVSPSYISRLIKSKYGKTFIELLTNTRINRAKTLLLDTQMPIQQVSSAVGFTEYIYFYKMFRKHTGMSPLQYRHSGRYHNCIPTTQRAQ